MSEWLPIQYRDFYDIPRAFVVEHRGKLYFLDCPFSEDLDEYPSEYTVYRIDDTLRNELDTIPWTEIVNHSERIGSIHILEVVFDSTKRLAIDAHVFDKRLLP